MARKEPTILCNYFALLCATEQPWLELSPMIFSGYFSLLYTVEQPMLAKFINRAFLYGRG
jgi:hypothetical protein